MYIVDWFNSGTCHSLFNQLSIIPFTFSLNSTLKTKYQSYPVKGPEIIKFYTFWVNSGSKDKTFWIECCYWSTWKVHLTLKEKLFVHQKKESFLWWLKYLLLYFLKQHLKPVELILNTKQTILLDQVTQFVSSSNSCLQKAIY